MSKSMFLSKREREILKAKQIILAEEARKEAIEEEKIEMEQKKIDDIKQMKRSLHFQIELTKHAIRNGMTLDKAQYSDSFGRWYSEHFHQTYSPFNFDRWYDETILNKNDT